ncbi:MAG: SprT-like domain-containing protein, partial [Bacteroidales bacterium]|nr:SprT-like domain-containing protein [Bacteroidales bacterium]
MRPTQKYVRQKFHEFNKLMFSNTLPHIPIGLSQSKTYLGALRFTRQRTPFGKEKYSDFQLVISTLFDHEEAEIEDAIIHEMIHLYIHHHHLHDNSAHGSVFRRMMANINQRFNRHVDISRQLTEEDMQSNTTATESIIGIATHRDGRTLLTRCARTRVFETHRAMMQKPDIGDIRWYRSF